MASTFAQLVLFKQTSQWVTNDLIVRLRLFLVTPSDIAYGNPGSLNVCTFSAGQSIFIGVLFHQITSEELDNILHETIQEHGFNSIKDLGKLLGFLKNKYPGQLDMQMVAEKAKKNLQS